MTSLHPDMPTNAAHWGKCQLCGRTTWISTERDWCTQRNSGVSGCKFRYLAAHNSGETPFAPGLNVRDDPDFVPGLRELAALIDAKGFKEPMTVKVKARKFATGFKPPKGS